MNIVPKSSGEVLAPMTLLTLGLYLLNSIEPEHLEMSSQPPYLLKEPVSRETIADLWF